MSTWRRVPVEQVVVFGGVEVHDDAGTIEELLVAAGAGDAVVAVPAEASVEQLLRLHLAARHPEDKHRQSGDVIQQTTARRLPQQNQDPSTLQILRARQETLRKQQVKEYVIYLIMQTYKQI